MTTLAITLAVIIGLGLLRFGVSAEYGADGVSVSAHVGFLSVHVFPRKAKLEIEEKKKKAKKKPKKEKGKKKKKDKKEAKKPGGLQGLLDILKAVKKALNRLRRRLLIKELTIHFISAGDDPSKTAMMFGAANAAAELVVPALEKAFRIKRRDFRAAADFCAKEPCIYVKASISIAVWEVVYIACALLPLILANMKKNKKSNRKDVLKDGETPD